MISCYRRVSRLFLKNIRTLFLDTSKLSPRTPDTGYDTTDIEWNNLGNKYRLKTATNRENVQILFISNQEFELETHVYCNFQIGVGFNDDPLDRRGLAHLFEHTVAMASMRGCIRSHSCYTEEFYTALAWYAGKETLVEEFDKWSNHLFSPSKLETECGGAKVMEEIVKLEVERVDNEFHESRVGHRFLDRIFAVLDCEKVWPCKFGMGTRHTFGTVNSQLMKKLEELRSLYRRRPVSACVYSKMDLDETTRNHICNSMLQFLNDKRHDVRIRPNYPKNNEHSKRLFVLKSDDGSLKLKILFPWKRELNRKEMNTFRFLEKMISCEVRGCLADYLRHEKMGTVSAEADQQGFCITVNLTENGLEKILEVSSAVRQYVFFILDNWEELVPLKYRYKWTNFNKDPDLSYVHEIVDTLYFTEPGSKIDEDNLREPQDSDKEPKLLKDHLNNENIVHIIDARDHESVLKTISKFAKNPQKRTEKTFMADYYVYKTQLQTKEGNIRFQLEDLNVYAKEGKCSGAHKFEAFVTEPKDVVFQNLCVEYIKRKSAHVRAIYDPTSSYLDEFTVKPSGVTCKSTNARVKAHFDSKLDHFEMPNNEEFLQCKEHLMSALSESITNYSFLAKSLMETAVSNMHSKNKEKSEDPIPMQYERLQAMDIEAYRQHFKTQHSGKFDKFKFVEFDSSVQKSFDKKFIIKSINNNEPMTFTIAFYKIPPGVEAITVKRIVGSLHRILYDVRITQGIYTVNCKEEEYNGIEGICVEISSVESKENQSSEKILEQIEHMVNTELAQKCSQPEWEKELKTFKEMIKCKIIIQIKGNERPSANVGSFKVGFNDWYKTYVHTFRNLASFENS